MPNKTGLHVVSGSRNGYGNVVGMACVTAVNEGGALLEAKSKYNNTLTVFRLTSPQPFYLEAPQGIDSWDIQTAIAHADWIYPQFKVKWLQNTADYYTVLNEPFNDQNNIDVYLAYERRLIDLSYNDGFRICMLNLAGGSPSIDVWQSLVVPHLAYGFTKGAIYGRHAYGGSLMPLDGNTGRPFVEADYLTSKGLNGGIVITELGVNGGYGYYPDLFTTQYPQYDNEMRKRQNIIGACWWTIGDWSSGGGNSNYQNSLGWFSDYVRNDPASKWTPPAITPPIVPDLPVSFNSIRIMQNTIGAMTLDNNIKALAQETIRMTYELENEDKPQPPIDPPVPPVTDFRILDISYHQADLTSNDWKSFVDKGVKGVYIRLSRDLTVDYMALTHYQNAKAYGLMVGFYHYLDVRPQFDINKQVELFTKEASKYDYDMPLAVDVEEYKNKDGVVIIPLPNLSQVKQFTSQVIAKVGRCTIYTSAVYYNRVSTTDNCKCELWVAHYTTASKPSIPKAWNTYRLWQYTSKGFDGKSSLDVNKYNGTYEEYLSWCNYTKPQPPTDKLDVWSYMMPSKDNVTYEVRHQDGSQERIQNQHGDTVDTYYHLFIVKGENQGYWERWRNRGGYNGLEFIYLMEDTSPANDSQNTPRYYKVTPNNIEDYKAGGSTSAWCKRFMSIGEEFDDGGHHVQFYAKSDCRELPENSGNSANYTKLIAHIPTLVLNGIVLQDCIKIGNPSGEVHIFCKGIGRVAWYSAWGNSEISELHQDGTRPVIKREVIGCM